VFAGAIVTALRADTAHATAAAGAPTARMELSRSELRYPCALGRFTRPDSRRRRLARRIGADGRHEVVDEVAIRRLIHRAETTGVVVHETLYAQQRAQDSSGRCFQRFPSSGR
jgi:hypothetical protein